MKWTTLAMFAIPLVVAGVALAQRELEPADELPEPPAG